MGNCASCKEDFIVDISDQTDCAIIHDWTYKKLQVRHNYSQKDLQVLKEVRNELKQINRKVKHFEIKAGDSEFGQEALSAYLIPIRHLDLEGFSVDLSLTNKVGGQSLALITQNLACYKNLSNLKLDFSNNQNFEGRDVRKALEAVAGPLKTVYLNFSKTKIGDKPYEAFVEVIGRCNMLEKLDINAEDSQLGDEGLAGITAMLNVLGGRLPAYQSGKYQLDLFFNFDKSERITAEVLRGLAKAAIAIRPSTKISISCRECLNIRGFNFDAFAMDLESVRKGDKFQFVMDMVGSDQNGDQHYYFKKKMQKLGLNMTVKINK